jgi:hypothetical protein
MMRKICAWSALAFTAFYAITNPSHTAGLVRWAASGVGAFASALAGGR